MNIPRPEYPRPDFVRDSYICLNGSWDFEFDDADAGIKEKWYLFHDYSRQIQVPFAYQTKLSGIGDLSRHDILWYHRELDIAAPAPDKELILHFGAIDYTADIFSTVSCWLIMKAVTPLST